MTNPLLFVSGSGTQVGKTTIAISLLEAAHSRNIRCAGLKALESGVGTAGPTDALAWARAAGQAQPHCFATFTEPLSLDLAAEKEGRCLERASLEQWIRSHQEENDFTVVEGAGGLLSPFFRDGTGVAEMTAALGAHLLLVIPNRLGTLHSARCCVEAARSRGISSLALLINPLPPLDSSHHENPPHLRRLLPDTPIFVSPKEIPKALDWALGKS